MKQLLFVFTVLLIPSFARAAQGDFYFDPHGAVGYNPAQGTHFMLGVDLGMEITENLRGGLGAYFAAGEQAEHDREYGVGPFATYVQPMTSFLVGQLRQEVNYVNLHDPIKTQTASGITYTHNEEEGFVSVTSASLHVFFTRNFVLSGGYRFVLGLSNDALDDGRSGAFVGFSIGF